MIITFSQVVVVHFLGEEMGESVARNKKAFHDYEILEKFEAGLSLEGSEVKALRAGRVNLKDSFVKIIKNEAFLMNAHISYFETTHSHYKPDERRPRKLLLHKKEIYKLHEKSMREGLTIVPLSIYFNHKNLAKVQIALAKGKKLHDKRETLKKKEADRAARAAMKDY
jgi:SsrA-binding protein